MSEFINWINANNFKSFEEIENNLKSPPNNFRIEQNNNLYLVRYKKNKIGNKSIISTNMEHPVINCSRGLILDKFTHDILCYPLEKSMSIHKFYSIPFGEFTFEDSIDGTQINMFYFNRQWRLSTSGCINAFKSYWKSNKSFGELFTNIFIKTTNINLLNKNYCYSFILTHPENINVVEYTKPEIYHIMTRNLFNYQKVDDDINVQKPNKHRFCDEIYLWNYLDNLDASKTSGIVAKHPIHGHYRFNSTVYNTLNRLIANEKNDEMVVLRQLMFRNNLDILISHIDRFQNVKQRLESDIDSVCNEIYNYYYNTKILRCFMVLPYYIKPLMFEIHDIYISRIREWESKLSTENKFIIKPVITLDDVMEWFITIPERRKLFIINRWRNKKKLD